MTSPAYALFGAKTWAGAHWKDQIGLDVPLGLDIDFTSGALPSIPGLTFTRATEASYWDSAGKLQFAAAGVPRFDYDPVTKAALGLLIEDQSTNLIKRSYNPIGGLWTATGDAKLVVSYVGDSAALTASGFPVMTSVFKLDASTCTAPSYITYNEAGPNNTVMTASCWVRAGNAGTVGKLAGVSANWAYNETQYALTDKYVRIRDTRDTLTYGRISVSVPAGGLMYMCLPQYEVGSFASSYIPTRVGATVTRNGDILQVPAGAWFSGAAGTIYANFDRTPGTDTGQTIVDMYSDGSNRLQFRAIAGNITHMVAMSGGASSWDVGGPSIPASPAKVKAAFSWGGGGGSLVNNGGDAVRDEAMSIPPITDWYIGRAQWGGEYLNGHLSRLKFVPGRDPDATMKANTA